MRLITEQSLLAKMLEFGVRNAGSLLIVIVTYSGCKILGGNVDIEHDCDTARTTTLV
jgi:hypothetical protein